MVYTAVSKPYLATNCGNAEAVRRPATVAARTKPPTRAISKVSASQERQRRRISARNTSLNAATPTSSPQCDR